MKKSSVFSNKSVTFRDLLSNYSIFVLILLVIFAISFFVMTLGPTYFDGEFVFDITNHIKTKDGQYHYSSADSELVLLVLIPFMVFLLQFSFLHKKSSCYTTLSFNVNRIKLYRNRLLLPLLFMLIVILATKLYVLKLNIDVYGIQPFLIQTFFSHLLIYIKIFLFTVFCTVFSCLMCGRTIEAVASGASIFALPSVASAFIGIINHLSLYGATDYSETIITRIAAALNPLDSTDLYYLNVWDINSPYYKQLVDDLSYAVPYYEQYSPPIQSIVISAVWIVALCIGLLALGKYFEKSYKPEKCGFKGVNAVTSSFSSITLPLYITLIVAMEFVYSTSYTVIPTALLFKYFVIGVLILISCALICNFLIHFTFKKVKYALIGTLVSVIFSIALIGINSTDIFNTYNKLPDKDDIAEISLNLSYNSFLNINNTDANIFNDPYRLSPNFFVAKEEDSIEAAMDFHKSVINNRRADTDLHATITYNLKEGTTKEWEYSFLSDEAIVQSMNLRQTTIGEDYLRQKLLPDTITYPQGESPEILHSKASLIISPLPGSTFYPDLTKISEQDFRMLREAIFEDVLSLSKEEWFTPTDPCLGYIVIKVPVINASSKYDYYYDDDSKPFSTPIYNSMEKTIAVLKRLGFMDYFNAQTPIEEVYVADLSAMMDYISKDMDYIVERNEDLPQLTSGVIFSTLYSSIPFDKNTPLTKVENKAEWKSLFEKAYPYYYVGAEKQGKVILVIFGENQPTKMAIYYIP